MNKKQHEENLYDAQHDPTKPGKIPLGNYNNNHDNNNATVIQVIKFKVHFNKMK